MDIINGSSRFRHRKTPSFDRFLTLHPNTHTQNDVAEENELNEDDIFSTGDFSAESLNHHSPSSSAASTPRNLHNKPAFLHSDSYGILAALPELRPNPTHRHHHLYQKSTLSTVSSSSARSIPAVPRRVTGAAKYQSAPLNVPLVMRRRRGEEEESGGDGEMVPPHEMVARQQSPMVAFSVLEGVGRTLKGRDLRQVRNAVFRRTGFLD